MAWIKTAAARREHNWVFVDDSLTGKMGRSMLVFARDGLIAGLLLGVSVGLLTTWPEAAWQAHKSGWTQRMRDVSDQIGVGPARPQPRPAAQPKPAPVAAPAPQGQGRNDGTDMESGNGYMPKWDVGFSASAHTLSFRLACMPARTPCATAEEPAYLTFNGPASSKLTAELTMRPTADRTSYTSAISITGPDQPSAPGRVLLPAGVWRMTVVFPRFAKQSEKTFWVSCPRGEACSAVDYAIPIIER